MGGKRTAELDFDKLAEDETSRLRALINQSDFVGVLKRYPIRESCALDAIARALDFSDRGQYEETVRKLLADNPQAVKLVRTLLGSLPDELIA
jgi:hypothetical protein